MINYGYFVEEVVEVVVEEVVEEVVMMLVPVSGDVGSNAE